MNKESEKVEDIKKKVCCNLILQGGKDVYTIYSSPLVMTICLATIQSHHDSTE